LDPKNNHAKDRKMKQKAKDQKSWGHYTRGIH